MGVKSISFAIIAVVSASLMASCSSRELYLKPYQPRTLSKIYANISVETFKYYPPNSVSQNEVQSEFINIYLGKSVVLAKDSVGSYFSDAVRRELRQAGADILNNKCILNGDINRFFIKQISYYNMDIYIDVIYHLSLNDGTAIYSKIINFTHHITKDSHSLISLTNHAISSNIQIMFDDNNFIAAASDHCSVH